MKNEDKMWYVLVGSGLLVWAVFFASAVGLF
jgi:hypothetical protein